MRTQQALAQMRRRFGGNAWVEKIERVMGEHPAHVTIFEYRVGVGERVLAAECTTLEIAIQLAFQH